MQLQSANDRLSSQLVDVQGNDMHAIAAWLRTKQLGSAHSVRAYKAAAFSLREWLCEKHKSNAPDLMIRLTALDAQAFVEDLFRPRSAQKPPPKRSTVKHRITILTTLYNYWSQVRDGGVQIVKSNPFLGISKTLRTDQSSNIGSQRALSPQEVNQVLHTIDQLASGPSAKHVHRTKLIWLLASRLALRREEIATLRACDFSMSSTKQRWILRIKGKGRIQSDEADVVVVPDEVMLAIQAYRASIGKYPHPLPSESGPLLLRLSHEKSSRPGIFISPEHIARIMKAVFRMAAKDAATRLQSPAMEQRLLQASIHWGRHTWFVNALKKHPIHLVSLGGRHKDIRTTQKSYVSLTEDDLAKLAD